MNGSIEPTHIDLIATNVCVHVLNGYDMVGEEVKKRYIRPSSQAIHMRSHTSVHSLIFTHMARIINIFFYC